MNPPSKAKLVKSKSSNSAIAPKSEKGANKKSLSNVEFKAPIKKRGVYVEKRPSTSKQFTQDNIETQPKTKAPPGPKPGKAFRASVLNILSKSTASTQCPPIAENVQAPTDVKQRNKSAKKPPGRQNPANQVAKTSNVPPKSVAKTETKIKKEEVLEKKKKPKYKSKALTEEVNKEAPERVLVLRSKRDIVHTPSNISKFTKDSNHSIKWADFLPKLIDSETMTPNNILEKKLNLDQSVANSILEGKKLNMSKSKEPETLVSAPGNDEKLYSLFVDMLETVYNGKPNNDAVSSVKSAESSEIRFEIDEHVAQKLTVPKQIAETFEDEPSQKHNYKRDDKELHNEKLLAKYYNSKPLYTKWSEPQTQPKRMVKRVTNIPKTNPFSFAKKPVMEKTHSAVLAERRSYYKKTKRQNLLSMLKEQLTMNYDDFEEPENFYQALRVIARNKRKTIHFDTSVKGRKQELTNSDSDYVCRFRRRKVISPSTRLSKNAKASSMSSQSKYWRFSTAEGNYSEISEESRSDVAPSRIRVDKESHHSLEVIGFDYEQNRSINKFTEDMESESDIGSLEEMTNWKRDSKPIKQLWKTQAMD